MSKQDRKTSSAKKPVGGSNMSNFISSVAVLLAVISLGGSGFALTQLFQLQQSFRELNASVQNSPVASEPQSPQTASSPAVSTTESSQRANTEIQPGQFVQYAFKDKAQVELLSVERIQNPDSGQRNVVNVRMRFRDLGASIGSVIIPNQTIARNPETDERYESYDRVADEAARKQAQRDNTEVDRSDRIERATGGVGTMTEEGSSVDGYVWLLIPEEVQTVDLIVPETATFLAVPITD
jgi:hypothetical protein